MKKFLLAVCCCCLSLSVMAQKEVDTLAQYRRSSLYTVLIKHSQLKFGTTIDSAFMSIPTPDKFNNHDLEIKSFESSAVKVKRGAKNEEKDMTNLKDIENFLQENNIAKALIAKWFNRDAEGNFNTNLVAERGLYDASQLDIRKAENTTRGVDQLADAGRDLIDKTFVMVNDITFLDIAEKTKKIGGFMRLAGAIAGAAGVGGAEDIANLAAGTTEQVGGFKVNISSYLYRLDWNEDKLMTFYDTYWVDSYTDSLSRAAIVAKFDEVNATDTLFRVSYVGKTTTAATIPAFNALSTKTDTEKLMKVSTRAIDKAIVELQREYDEFKVNVPIYKVNGDGTVDVQIGLKEGVNEKSEYDVLMEAEDENGRHYYERVGSIKPVADKIWDNRFGAREDAEALAADPKAKQEKGEEVGNVELNATTFKITSGENKIVPGCVVREVTIKAIKKKK